MLYKEPPSSLEKRPERMAPPVHITQCLPATAASASLRMRGIKPHIFPLSDRKPAIRSTYPFFSGGCSL